MSNTENNPLQNNQINDVASEFEKLLTPTEEQAEETEIEATDIPETETETVEAEEEVLEAEADEDEDLEESDEDEIEAEEEEQPELYAVKINGQEEQVTLDELVSGYSRQKDYTQKTQKIAEQEKAFKEKMQEVEQQSLEISDEKALYKELLPKMQLALKNNLEAEPDWQRLIDESPQEYLKLKEEWSNKNSTLEMVENEIARVQAETQKEEARKLQEQVDLGKQLISEKIPEWQDEKVAQEETKLMMEYAQTLGFTNNELGEIYDGRLVLLLRDAWSHSKTKKALKTKPKSSPHRVAKAGTSNRIKSNTPLKKAKQRLKQTGKVSDASKVIEQLL
jgi:hypothetical protein